MNGSRAKNLRRLARRQAARLNPQSPPVEQCYGAAKRAWKQRRQARKPPIARSDAPVVLVGIFEIDRGGRKRLTFAEQRIAARKRGAAEAAERRQLLAGDEWLVTQPWMSIQRLRRVAANRKAVSK